MNRSFSLPLAVSLAGHGGLVAALILLVGNVPLTPLPVPQPRGIEVRLAPAEPIPPPPIPEIPPPPPPVVETPPRPPPVAEVTPPLPPAPAHPVRKPVVRPPVRRPPPRPMPERARVRRAPTFAPPPATVQSAAVPRPVAPPAPEAPIASASYRAVLSAWVQAHARYPQNAPARREQGLVLLRFRIDRWGRVLNYAVVRSSGYPDLDAAVDAMMQGAILPAFPPEMTAASLDVTVTLRFALSR